MDQAEFGNSAGVSKSNKPHPFIGFGCMVGPTCGEHGNRRALKEVRWPTYAWMASPRFDRMSEMGDSGSGDSLSNDIPDPGDHVDVLL